MFAYINVEYENKIDTHLLRGYIREQGLDCTVCSAKIIYIMYKCLKRLHKCKIESGIQVCVI